MPEVEEEDADFEGFTQTIQDAAKVRFFDSMTKLKETIKEEEAKIEEVEALIYWIWINGATAEEASNEKVLHLEDMKYSELVAECKKLGLCYTGKTKKKVKRAILVERINKRRAAEEAATAPAHALPTDPAPATPNDPAPAPPTNPAHATPTKPAPATPTEPAPAKPIKPCHAPPTDPARAPPTAPTPATPTDPAPASDTNQAAAQVLVEDKDRGKKYLVNKQIQS